MTCTPDEFAGTVLGSERFQLGEGPTYDPATDTAWWFDILGYKLIEYGLASDTMKIHDLPMMASALAFVDERRQIIVNEDGLCVREVKSGTFSRYLDIESDKPDNRSNDARVHPSGALWVGTMSKKGEDRQGAIYHAFKGTLTRLYDAISIPNAICFSPDGSIGYFADTREGDVLRVALDPQTGLPDGEPAVFLAKGSTPGNPDGAVVDAAGNFWNARWGAGAVDVHSPDGQHLKSIDFPAECTSCPAFVGSSADRLLVTSAHNGLDEAGRAAHPLAGAAFLVDAAAKGRFDPRFAI